MLLPLRNSLAPLTLPHIVAAAGGGGTFDPSSIAGLKLWLKGDAGTYSNFGITPATNGGNVQQWNDQSGNGNNATASGTPPVYGTSRLNGLPTVRCPVGNESLDVPTAVGFNTPTIFLVVTAPHTGGAAYKTPYFHYDRFAVLTQNLNGFWGTYLGGDVAPSVTLVAGSWNILSVTVRALNDVDFGTNGAGVSTQTNGAAYDTSPESQLNRHGGGGGQTDTFEFAEVLVYDNPLSDANRILVRDYLNAKYAIF